MRGADQAIGRSRRALQKTENGATSAGDRR
jgi:hypothetical protein